MKSTQNSEETQELPHKKNFTLTELEERVSSAKRELYLLLRDGVIKAFMEYNEIEEPDLANVLSNVLLSMDEIFRKALKGVDE